MSLKINKSESRIQVGDSINTRNSGWKFDIEVVANFESHVRRSIPLYETGHQLVCELSDFFIHDGSLCYELGTSVGELIEKVSIQNSHKKIKFIGLDIEEGMIAKARERCKQYENIQLQTADLNLYEFERSD